MSKNFRGKGTYGAIVKYACNILPIVFTCVFAVFASDVLRLALIVVGFGLSIVVLNQITSRLNVRKKREIFAGWIFALTIGALIVFTKTSYPGLTTIMQFGLFVMISLAALITEFWLNRRNGPVVV